MRLGHVKDLHVCSYPDGASFLVSHCETDYLSARRRARMAALSSVGEGWGGGQRDLAARPEQLEQGPLEIRSADNPRTSFCIESKDISRHQRRTNQPVWRLVLHAPTEESAAMPNVDDPYKQAEAEYTTSHVNDWSLIKLWGEVVMKSAGKSAASHWKRDRRMRHKREFRTTEPSLHERQVAGRQLNVPEEYRRSAQVRHRK